MVSLPNLNPVDAINRVPCWTLRFYKAGEAGGRGSDILTLNHRSHTASISLVLQGGLTAGQLSISLGRLTTKDFEKLVLEQEEGQVDGDTQRVQRRGQIYVGVQLYWKSPMKAALDFEDMETIETFRITELKREVDGLDVVTKIKGQRALYDRLANQRLPDGDGLEAQNTFAMIETVLGSIGLQSGPDFEVYSSPLDTAPDNPMRLMPKTPVLEAMARLKSQMLKRPPHRRGRSLYLIRNDKLHIGPFRPIPYGGSGEVKDLNAAKGLISIEQNGETSSLDPSESALENAAVSRRNYSLKCAGRRDLQPGDVIKFEPPSETDDLFGGFGLPSLPSGLGGSDGKIKLYLATVSHRFNTSEGWLTFVAGVEIKGDDVETGAWDVVQSNQGIPPDEDDSAIPTTGAERISQSIGRRINNAISDNPTSTIAEIRDHAITTVGADFIEQAAQTSSLISGFVDMGGPHQSRLDDIDRASGDIQVNVPYATNFAWGPFGHILPRYPGMRVLLLNNKSNRDDPVDIGALWKTDSDDVSTAPAYGERGDWWLMLPSFADGPPDAAEGTDPVTIDGSVKTTHDLITSRGDRVIEVAGLTIRAFKQEDLFEPNRRPTTDAADGEILITQGTSGTSIKIGADGAVEIISAKGLSIQTEETITIDSGGDLILEGDNIELNARSGGKVDAKNV